VSPFFNVKVGPHVAFCETAMVVGAGDAEPVIGRKLTARRPSPPPMSAAIAAF
jgi:hypothetical protein